MEKADFLDRVAHGLSSHGLSGGDVSKYTSRVSALLDELPPDELAAILNGGIDIEAFVADLLSDADVAESPAKEEKKETQKPEAPQKKQQADRPEKKEEPKKKEAPAPKKEEAPKPKKEAPKKEEAQKKEAAPKREAKSSIDEHREKAPTERLPVRPAKGEESGKLRNPGKVSDTRDHTAFNALFWALSPLWLVLTLFVYVFLALMILTFVALIVVFVVVLLAVVVAGAALALVGIIYGATQVFDDATLAVGLYEIGQGIVIGGVTMFGGIVLYNFAVRFFPWLIKQTVHMMGGFARGLKRLYYRVKGAMAR
ncbi:MAG: hypothetical protein IJF74_00635 [Clostridia bacterium]|nr:hypothetical protein [Clostridia bacterium]